MNLYSYQGQEPQSLPTRFRLEDGSTLTELDKLSQEELSSLGFSGPIESPEIDVTRQELSWDGEKYTVTDIPSEVLEQRESEQKRKAIESIANNDFFSVFKSTIFNTRIRKESSVDLKTNTLYTELISNIKTNSVLTEVFEDFNRLFLTIKFTEDEVASLQECLSRFNLNYEIPNEEYLTSNSYDFDTDSIVNNKTKPFDSWIWNGKKWTAPVPYPTDGKPYVWNDKTQKWKKL